MVAFTSARRAVTCAVDIQRAMGEQRLREPARAVSVRIGLNTGEVVREEEDLFGATVNAAARIAAEGDAGEILVSEGVKIILGSATTAVLEEHGEAQLKGFDERWQLYSVQWEEAAAPGSALDSGRTPYVGRQDERAQLRQLLEQASNGQGGLVMIGGEPGVGKTRIAEELIAEAEAKGFLALVGHCYDMEGAPPYLPFVEIMQAAMKSATPEALRTALGDEAPEVAKIVPELRRLFPDIPPPLELPPAQERHYLFDSLRAFTARASVGQPIIMLLDDLHWADDSTLLLVQHYAQQLSSMSVLMVGTYRDVELDVGRPLAKVLEDLLRQRLAHRISIRRLPLEDVAGMLRAASGQDPPQPLVDVVYSETEGNPFFVEEVFQHFREEGKLFDEAGTWRAGLEVGDLDVPEGVRLVIGRRLQHVDEETRGVLTNAAVIGRVFSFDLLDAVGDEGADRLLDAVDEAEAAHLIAPVDAEGREARYMFSHELIRQTLISSLSLPRRQRLHLKIAEAMEQAYVQTIDEHVADLAHHLYQAGAAADAEKTVKYLALAGNKALTAAAFEDALRLYDEAVALRASDQDATQADLRYQRGMALRSLGRGPEARADWERAVAIFEELGEGESTGEVCEDLSFQLGWEANWAEALVVAQRGLANMGRGTTSGRGRLLAHVGMIHGLGGAFEAGAPLLEEASSIAGELGDGDLLGRVLESKLANTLWYARVQEAAEIGSQAIQLHRAAGRLWNTTDVTWITGYALAMLGRFDESLELEEQATELAVRIGHQGGALSAQRGVHGVRFFRTGDLEELKAFWQHDRDEALRLGNPWVSNAYANLAFTAFWRGHWNEALELAQEAARLEPDGMLVGFDWGSLFVLTAYAGTRDDALTMLAEQNTRLPTAGKANTLGRWAALHHLVEGLAVLERFEDCGRLYPLAKELIDTGMVATWWYAQPHTTAGIAAMAAEEWGSADEHFQAALEAADNLPVVIAQPEVRRWYARMLLRRDAPGDADNARTLIEEAISSYRKLGMPKHIDMAEAMLGEV